MDAAWGRRGGGVEAACGGFGALSIPLPFLQLPPAATGYGYVLPFLNYK